MALKFLNKKGWHTGSLRNIENVWKAEQKHEAEQRKLEELRKQIQDEREKSEFRLLQQQAGLVPRQERLDFLYDSGLAVGKTIGSSSGGGGSGVAFKALEETAPANNKPTLPPPSAEASRDSSAVPGALFEDKPHSANDAWRKLHSDPLLLIRQREQEALARIKNNPVQMALIRKSVEANKEKAKSPDEKEHKKKKQKHKKRSSSKKQMDSKPSGSEGEKMRSCDDHKTLRYGGHSHKERFHSDNESERETNRTKKCHDRSKYRGHSPNGFSSANFEQLKSKNHSLHGNRCAVGDRKGVNLQEAGSYNLSHYKRRNSSTKLSEEERAAKLREMQIDAELHEEQRLKRLRRADDDDARKATHDRISSGRNFLDAAHKNVYGAEKGGSVTIEESVRRRTHYSQRGSGVGDSNAFRR